MRTLIFILFNLLFTSPNYAQVIYYDSLWNVVDQKSDAKYYREVKPLKKGFQVTDFYISGQPQMIGTYQDSEYKIKHGNFTYYYENGQKSSEGAYKKNEKVGDWYNWQPNGEPWVEIMPEYPGGTSEMMKYLQQSIVYPVEARANKIQGRVVLQFVIGDDGSISQIVVIKSVHPSLDGEAVRVVSGMPAWKPGMQNNKPVFVKFTLPIVFKLK